MRRQRAIQLPDPESFTVLPGLGVNAIVGGREIFVGRLSAMEERGITSPHAVEDANTGQAAMGRNVIALAIDRKMAGIFSFEDELRAGIKGDGFTPGRNGSTHHTAHWR